MAMSSNSSTTSTKKSRATSCTSCRQVKLKCDLKERYPQPCSRCTVSHHECKTDASFKRIPARSRIKDLETQIDQLKRSRASESNTPRSSIEFTPELVYRMPSIDIIDEGYSTSCAGSASLSHTSPSPSIPEPCRQNGDWLHVTHPECLPPFVLGNTVIHYPQAQEIFQHFECHAAALNAMQQPMQEPATNLFTYHQEPNGLGFNEPVWAPPVVSPNAGVPYEAWANELPQEQWQSSIPLPTTMDMTSYPFLPTTL